MPEDLTDAKWTAENGQPTEYGPRSWFTEAFLKLHRFCGWRRWRTAGGRPECRRRDRTASRRCAAREGPQLIARRAGPSSTRRPAS
ncbi:hypothetical protein V5799_032290 [Amblyomma americanum]|uniref:Uncharacterized protein n=1 Tax=Amblyomma americanum TaxID=6943 RepID=A0AAQ4DRK8_AMBAM